LAVAGSAGAATGGMHPVAFWRFNEAAGASVAIDSGPNRLNADVGGGVRTGQDFNPGTGYVFPAISESPPPHPDHLVTLADNNLLDPGTGNFAVKVRIRTTQDGGNIVQKGQSGSPGGYWKVEAHLGVVTCLFRSGDGRQSTASSLRRLDDGRWHTIYCKRTPSEVRMRVDGVHTDTRFNSTGNVSNDKHLMIGGKLYCDQSSVGCDYFFGDIGFVKISAG